jgi:hypothetical protein
LVVLSGQVAESPSLQYVGGLAAATHVTVLEHVATLHGLGVHTAAFG